jgi:regulator of sigma E protease
MDYILSFVIVLGVLIFFHEFGHFLVARLFGVGVEKFSLGFGPRIFGKTIGLTDYRISAIPLGGYVKMVGEEPDVELPPEKIPLSFTHKHAVKRICIVAAGPVFNYLLAIIIFFGFFQIYGVRVLEPVIGTVEEGSPAQISGMKEKDRIVEISGERVQKWDDMADIIQQSRGNSIELTIIRDGVLHVVKAEPVINQSKNLFGEDVERYIIGITASGDVVEKALNPFQALSESIIHTWNISTLMVKGVYKLIKGDISADNLGGPIMIAQMAGDQAKEGAENLIYFIAFISINLAILNFLPIPVLDGGHILFFSIEALRGKPLSLRAREMAQQGGMFILILLMMFVIYNDIMRLNLDDILHFFNLKG